LQEALKAKMLTKDEARRIAVNIALLREPLEEPLARRRLSPSRSRVLILPAQEFSGVSVCRTGLRSGGRVRSR
jgi:hypothetical protein